jgi:hypothetical protein
MLNDAYIAVVSCHFCQVSIVHLAKREKERRGGQIGLFTPVVLCVRKIVDVQFICKAYLYFVATYIRVIAVHMLHIETYWICGRCMKVPLVSLRYSEQFLLQYVKAWLRY